MKKRVWVGGVALVVFIVLIVVFYVSLSRHPTTIKPAILSNVTELYSLFTPTMENFVNVRLEPTECQKNEYYYNDSSFCFLCGKFDACFGYGWVNRTGGERMNPQDVFLSGSYSKEDEINFYSFGVSKLLNCKCNEECVCEDGIKADKSAYVFFIFPITMNITAKLGDIAGRMGAYECNISTDGVRFECNNLRAEISNNTVVFGR